MNPLICVTCTKQLSRSMNHPFCSWCCTMEIDKVEVQRYFCSQECAEQHNVNEHLSSIDLT